MNDDEAELSPVKCLASEPLGYKAFQVWHNVGVTWQSTCSNNLRRQGRRELAARDVAWRVNF